jgi:uncharacterized membrane protein YraQ (UPF0718 family)
MKATALAMLGVLLALMAAALWRGGETFWTGLTTSGRQLVGFLPVLVIAMLLAGFTEALLPKRAVETWLSDAAGWRGIALAWLAGVLTPGGSIVGLPLIAGLHRAGVGVAVLMTYSTSLATLSLLRLPLETGFYGWRLTALRFCVSLVLPFIAGGLTLGALRFIKV